MRCRERRKEKYTVLLNLHYFKVSAEHASILNKNMITGFVACVRKIPSTIVFVIVCIAFNQENRDVDVFSWLPVAGFISSIYESLNMKACHASQTI